jgi:hypothetical protein
VRNAAEGWKRHSGANGRRPATNAAKTVSRSAYGARTSAFAGSGNAVANAARTTVADL